MVAMCQCAEQCTVFEHATTKWNLDVADDILDGVVDVEDVNVWKDAREHVHGATNGRNGHLLAAGAGDDKFAGWEE